MDDLRGKRLLLLGGVMPACAIVQEAKKLGVTVYVTDYLENSPAKKLADKSFMVSTTDVDAVAALCRDEKIDGVITGYVDLLLPYCEQICRNLGMPFWGNQDNIRMSINKDVFKLACERAGVPVVPWKKVSRDDYLKNMPERFPVVVKPVDNSGSRGVYKCYRREDFEACCAKALTFSKAGELMVERLMDVNAEFSVYYIMNHGRIYLTGMGDRYVRVVDDALAPVGQGMFFPSRRLPLWIEKMDPLMRSFFARNNMNDGFVFIQGFTEGEEFYINEIGYRLNGGFSYKITEQFSRYNQVQQLIRFALTGEMEREELDKSDPAYDGYSFLLTAALKPGVIGRIEGAEKISDIPGVISFEPQHTVGESLTSVGTTAQVYAYIPCQGQTVAALRETVRRVEETLAIYDSKGEPMLYGLIDPDRIDAGSESARVTR